MRVVRVHDVHVLVADERPHPQHVAGERPWPEASVHVQPVDHLETRLLRLGLEAIARDQPEQDAVTAGAEAGHEVDDRIGTAGPPAVRGQVQDRQPRHEVPDRSAATRSPTAAAEIPRMQGCSIGHTR